MPRSAVSGIILALAVAASTPVLKLAHSFFENRSTVVQKSVVNVLFLILLFACVIIVTASLYNPFIYFRF